MAEMVAITTADSPKMVFAQSGNSARQPPAWITPTPRATERPTTEVFLAVSSSFVISLMPVMVIMAKTETVAPPSTQEGMVVKREANRGTKPAIRMITAARPSTQRFTTFVMVTMPTFWLKVAVGSPPKNAPIILATPFPIIPPHIS